MPSEAQKRARDKWDRENMATISMQCRRAMAEKYRAAAARAGVSVSSVMRSALDQLLADFPEDPKK